VYGILTHLESDVCASKITRVELHTMLVEQQNSQDVIYRPLLQDMVQGLDLYVKYGRSVSPFICPASCPSSFKTLADLVKHTEGEGDVKCEGGGIVRRVLEGLAYRISHGLL